MIPAPVLVDRFATLRRYLDGEVTAEQAADLLGPGVVVADVVIETRERFGRLPDRRDAFAEAEFGRAIRMLGLGAENA